MNIVKTLILLSFTLLFVTSCSTTKKYKKDTNLSYYGEVIDPAGYIKLDDMFTILEKKGTYTGKVRGEVSSVCQNKGCWMTLVTPDKNKELFIKFKDYGFFMPMDLTGEVVINGTAQKEVTSVKDLRHYAMDGGATEEEVAKITEPETSFRFLADGVVKVK